jgi:TolA-binding protein
VDNYGSTPSARMACFTLANMFFKDKQYAKAEQYFRKILDDYSKDKMMTASASANVGSCLEMKSDYLGAAKMYKQAAEVDPNDLWSPGYLLKAGQNFAKSNDKKSAQAVFSEIEKNYPNSQENSTARRSLAELNY